LDKRQPLFPKKNEGETELAKGGNNFQLKCANATGETGCENGVEREEEKENRRRGTNRDEETPSDQKQEKNRDGFTSRVVKPAFLTVAADLGHEQKQGERGRTLLWKKLREKGRRKDMVRKVVVQVIGNIGFQEQEWS